MPQNPKLDSRLDNTLKHIWKAVYTPAADLKTTAWVTKEPEPWNRRTSGVKKVLTEGKKWGGLFDCAWFNFKGTVPRAAAGKKISLLIDVAGELLVVDKDGNPLQGLTSQAWKPERGFGRWEKKELPWLERARGGENIDLWADAGCNNLFGALEKNGCFQYAKIAVHNPVYHDLFFDFAVLKDLFIHIPESYARRHTIRRALHDASDALLEYTDAEAVKARKILAPELAKKNGDPSLTFSAIGHAHLDLAWLWPERETWRKGARTFSTVLANMERYPDYVFGASQPQLYAWIKQKYPHLYRRIRKRVTQGRWEPQGCMWVEADTNITGGESLVRQVLLGKRFFREEFGVDVNHLWLPDVFGYTASLPQILAKSGCRYFLTQKLSWSKVDIYPNHTFWWEGIDGSRILTHFPPEDDYNGKASPHACEWGEKNYKDKDVCDRAMMLFGCGDGGGGPGVEHLESLSRIKNLAGIASVVQESATAFFRHIEKNGDRYATWSGELYLEFHQGTLTSQARNKRFNRLMENALRECELWSSMAARLANGRYPDRDLDRIWKRVLFFQFHDVLPGSSITRVYRETCDEYAELLKETTAMTDTSLQCLLGNIDMNGMKSPCAVFNSLSWERTGWVKTGASWHACTVPAMGWIVIDAAQKTDRDVSVSTGNRSLENDLIRCAFSSDGAVVSVYDKENGFEAIAPGTKANVFKVFYDDGDAWDFSMDYADRLHRNFIMTSSKSYQSGPLAVMEQNYAFGESKLRQRIILAQHNRRIDFVTEVDWKENGRMLRVEFPVGIRAPEVTCDIQFGSIRRPTHRNTPWDMAKQEICAHKWVDLSETTRGVALLNDCKYGHQVKDNVISLNLLRSPSHPDPVADRARHEFTYALYPHEGDHIRGAVSRAGYELNMPLRTVCCAPSRGKLPGTKPLFSVDNAAVIVETVKKAEDGDGIIVRMYESRGGACRARLQMGFDIKEAVLVNLLEEIEKKCAVRNNGVRLAFRPFEIVSVRIR